MCELLGMSANVPTDICFSFTGLARRGGQTGPHKDGWGVTFYEGKGYKTFKDPLPCYASPVAQLVQQYPIKSKAVVAHIRQANCGAVVLENTHPFTRELWGRYWTFAHNGQLKGYRTLSQGVFQPVGTTDSEYVFCWLLNQLISRYPQKPGHWRSLFRYLASQAHVLRELGVFNMLLSDGRYLMAYCSTHLHYITRQAPFGRAKLVDEDIEVDFQQRTTPNDVITIIATHPLTVNETWQKMTPGQFVLFDFGRRVL